MKKFDGNIIYFFPVVIMLIMGVVAYKAGSDLVDGRKDRSQAYYEYLIVLRDLQSSFHEFENEFELMLEDENDIGYSNIVRRHTDLKKSLFNLRTLILTRASNQPESIRSKVNIKLTSTLNTISTDINNVFIKLEELRNESGNAGKKLDDIYIHIENVHGSLIGLEPEIYKDVEHGFYTQEVSKKENALYWAICSMAIIGLILTLLNADKLSRLKKSEINKKKRVDELQSRMAALDMAKDGIIIMNSAGGVEYLNDALCLACGFPIDNKSNILGMSWGEIFTEEATLNLKDNVYPTLMEKGYWTGEFYMNRRDGTNAVTDLSLTQLPDGGVVGTIQDITERQQAEEDKKSLEAQFFQAQKMEAIGRLAGGIAHDFNNILSAIIGYSDMIKNDLPDNSPSKKHIVEVLKAGNRAKDLVSHILSFSRKEAKERSAVQIHLIAKEVLKLMRASIPTTIKIKQKIDPHCGNILAAPTQIHQILMNLCTNGAQSMDEKGGVLEVGLASAPLTHEDLTHSPNLKAGNYVHLWVKDCGVGIDKKHIDRIFDPYFTTKDVGKGSGMGLAVVLGIVTSYDGIISVKSKLGEGTTFNVYFPRINEKNHEQVTGNTSLPKGNERILVVDDEQTLVEMTKMRIERLGYQVTAKTSSLEALELFRSHPDAFDLVISDQTMPELTGEKLAKYLLQIRQDIPIIICTGYSSILDAEKANVIGIRDFIMKPVETTELASTIRQVLDHNTQEPK